MDEIYYFVYYQNGVLKTELHSLKTLCCLLSVKVFLSDTFYKIYPDLAKIYTKTSLQCIFFQIYLIYN